MNFKKENPKRGMLVITWFLFSASCRKVWESICSKEKNKEKGLFLNKNKSLPLKTSSFSLVCSPIMNISVKIKVFSSLLWNKLMFFMNIQPSIASRIAQCLISLNQTKHDFLSCEQLKWKIRVLWYSTTKKKLAAKVSRKCWEVKKKI